MVRSQHPVLAHHVGRQMYIDVEGRVSEAPSFAAKLGDAWRLGWNRSAFGQVAEHDMEEYVALLAKAQLSKLLPGNP